MRHVQCADWTRSIGYIPTTGLAAKALGFFGEPNDPLSLIMIGINPELTVSDVKMSGPSLRSLL